MRKPSRKARLSAALRAVEQASAVLVAVRMSVERMEVCDIDDALGACSGPVNEARTGLVELEAEE